ncbi:MAG TPA: hypothetical protein PLK77_07125 [Pyrinomonadaceae bacterium]|nr:hypothetical protein [Pyrinomonadaceae bacterium]
MHRRSFLIAFGMIAMAGIVAGYFATSKSEAQRNTGVRFEYAVINGNYLPYPADNPSVVSSAANICYLQAAGCQNEEVRSEVNMSKFAQDERLENSAGVRRLAQERAVQSSFSRAIAKLGGEGWEMISAPDVEFDLYYTNPQGIPSVKETSRTERRHIWFKRERQ